MPKQARLGGPKRSEAEARLAALLPIMRELGGLSDGDASRELNKRGVPTMNGGAWRPDGFQVARLRKRLGLDRKQDRESELIERIYKRMRENLAAHFGPASANDEKLLDVTAWAATAVYRKELLLDREPIDLTQVTSEQYREYKRDRGMLGALLNVLRIASDTFELVPPRELPHATKSRATAIFENLEILAKVESSRLPRDVTTDVTPDATPMRDTAS